MTKLPRPALLTLAAALLLHASFLSSVRADVTIRFSEIGGNVVATTTGSFAVPADGSFDFDHLNNAVNGGAFWFYYIDGDYLSWNDGSPVDSGLSQVPDFAEGDTFGFTSFGPTYVPSSALGTTFTPNTLWIWNNTTLADIGLGGLTADPFLVHNTAWGEHVYFAAIPEPATQALLLGAAVGVLTIIRAKRRRRGE